MSAELFALTYPAICNHSAVRHRTHYLRRRWVLRITREACDPHKKMRHTNLRGNGATIFLPLLSKVASISAIQLASNGPKIGLYILEGRVRSPESDNYHRHPSGTWLALKRVF